MMDPALMQLFGIGASLLGGALTKKLSKNKGSTLHKILAPAAAVGVGIGFEALTGMQLNVESMTAGTGTAASAVLIHSLYRGVKPKKESVK